MLRAFVYLVLGWLLIAVVGGLAEVLDLTVMLPATSAVILTHVAFSRRSSVPAGLAVAVALGYLEDLHQGAPIGTLTMAHALAFLVLHWASARLALTGWLLRGLVSMLAVLLVDVLTAGVLLTMADVLEIRRQVVLLSMARVHWHALATLLVAPPVWGLVEWTFVRLRLEERPPRESWTGR